MTKLETTALCTICFLLGFLACSCIAWWQIEDFKYRIEHTAPVKDTPAHVIREYRP